MKRIQELTDLLNKANDSYYRDNTPILTDKEFDLAMKELEALEKQHPDMNFDNSPTHRIPDDHIEGFEKVAHEIPMISIDNAYGVSEVKDYMDLVKSSLGQENVEFTSEMKIDGLSLGLRYDNGLLQKAVTRGSEGSGDDVTPNARTIRDIPLSIPYKGKVEVRGECYMERAQFVAINTKNASVGDKTYQNTRALASGSLKSKEVKEVARRKLRFRAFGLAEPVAETKTQEDTVAFMSSLGFLNVNTVKRVDTLEAFEDYCNKATLLRTSGKIPFDIDGIVVKVNQINQRDDLGRTSKHIKWAIAYKFDSEQARTKVLAITFQVGRTGKVVPVAELEPIFFMGTTTRRATLHNMNEIGRLGLHVGDYVLIEKGGDIIPKVVGVDVSAREKGAEPIPTPTKCPVCGAALEKRPGKIVDLFCSSEECPAKVINKLKYFVSRPCMNIKDLGPAMLEKLLDNGTIKEPLDLYALIPMHFEGLDGVGAKMVGKILDNIEASKEMPPLNLLAGMGIPWIGQGTSTKVMTRFGSWDSLWGATEAEIASVPDVGDLAASNFCLWREQNPDFLSKIKELGMKMEYKAPAVVEGVLNGRVVVVTGTLSDMSRDEAQKAIEANGGIFAKDITKKTNVLVVGADAGSKLAKAEKMGIDIWTEVVFREKAGL